MATEDADVLEPRVCEWESFGARTRTTGAASARAWATQVGCGLGAGTQAALAYSRATEDGVTGQGLSLGGKTGLIARKDGAIGLTLAWGMGAVKAPAHSWRLETTYLNLVATRDLAAGVTGHANLGWTHDRASGQHSTTWNLAAAAVLGRGVDVMAELYGDDRSKPNGFDSTLYYFRAYSSNDAGESSSNLYTVTTTSTDSTTGTINIYFNFSIDSSITLPGNIRKGNIVFKDKLIERINAAVYSIDMALYSFSDMPDVANAIILAKNSVE